MIYFIYFVDFFTYYYMLELLLTKYNLACYEQNATQVN